jgi:hypothetical protein
LSDLLDYVGISKDELKKSAPLLIGKPMMIDHAKSVRDLVGRVTKAEI